ncbi:MAG: hypothetical protein J1F14_05565 [Treponema sp.]|nr:hypothetical protein [Treponema sp.]
MRGRISLIKTAAAVVVNLAGIICLVIFSVPYLMHDESVRNPDAMLPAEAWDSAGMVLTAGVIPLLLANIFAFILFPKDMRKNPLTWLVFLPCALCLFLSVSYLLGPFKMILSGS